MDTQEQGTTTNGKTTTEGTPRSLSITERGIRTGSDFANMMSALMSDIISGRVTPQVGNAACNAGGKLLKIVEMQHQFGKPNHAGTKEIVLATEFRELE